MNENQSVMTTTKVRELFNERYGVKINYGLYLSKKDFVKGINVVVNMI